MASSVLMMDTLLWIAIVMISYTYLGYPLVVRLAGIIRNRTITKASITPRVSVIITVHDEEEVIEEKIENTLASDYPKEALEIIVVSDCSADRTDGIVSKHSNKGVKLLRLPDRRGKTVAQNLAIQEAEGDILVFTDASTRISPKGLRELVRNFADRAVGGVSSEDRSLTAAGKEVESLYVKYEMLIRRLESKMSSVTGMSGSFYAVRREFCTRLPGAMTRDFAAPLEIIKAGYRVVSDREALGYVKAVSSEKAEFERKVRTVIAGLTVFFHYSTLLNPFSYKWVSFQLISHKFFRWLIPFFLMLMLIISGYGSLRYYWYRIVFLLQLAFYILAGTDFLPVARGKFKVFSIPRFFVMTNVAIFLAWIKYFCGVRISFWEPSRR